LIQVLVVDDHPIVRQGLKQILTETGDISVSGEFETGHEALNAVRNKTFDAIVLDLSMPGGGIELVKHIREEKPDLPILVLSVHPEEHYAVRALKAGASGYLTKDSAPDQLVSALRKLAAGGRYITPSLGEKLAQDLQSPVAGKTAHDALSDREYQILRLLGQGKAIGDIAADLHLSPKTVSTYRSRILEKTGLKTTAELIRYAIDQGAV
jgi:two-component system invasion response regulator UvrY